MQSQTKHHDKYLNNPDPKISTNMTTHTKTHSKPTATTTAGAAAAASSRPGEIRASPHAVPHSQPYKHTSSLFSHGLPSSIAACHVRMGVEMVGVQTGATVVCATPHELRRAGRISVGSGGTTRNGGGAGGICSPVILGALLGGVHGLDSVRGGGVFGLVCLVGVPGTGTRGGRARGLSTPAPKSSENETKVSVVSPPSGGAGLGGKLVVNTPDVPVALAAGKEAEKKKDTSLKARITDGWQHFKHEMQHYWLGTKLLGKEVRYIYVCIYLYIYVCVYIYICMYRYMYF